METGQNPRRTSGAFTVNRQAASRAITVRPGVDGPVDVIIAARCRGQASMGDNHSEGSVGVPQRRLGVTVFD